MRKIRVRKTPDDGGVEQRIQAAARIIAQKQSAKLLAEIQSLNERIEELEIDLKTEHEKNTRLYTQLVNVTARTMNIKVTDRT